jgi:hypothetical protein
MQADRVAVSWDAAKHQWLVRIEVGQEVIRRFCKQAKDADDQSLQAAAEQTVIDEGYQVDKTKIVVSR